MTRNSIRLALRRALALTMTLGGLTLASMAMSTAASAQDTADACPGAPGTGVTYAFDGIPSVSAEMLPSVRRSMSILGLRAKNHDCAVRITCVSPTKDREDRRTMDRQCTTARNAVFAYERRSTVRNRLRAEADLVKMTSPSGGFAAGRVYVTLIAR